MSFIKSAFTVGANTLLTRILGFVREILIARTLGASDLSDIWVAAFRFPNLFRRMIAEGAFNAAFAPTYGRIHQEEGAEGAEKFSGNILSFMSLIIVIGTVLLQLAMPYIIYLLAPGYSDAFQTWLSGIVSWVSGTSAFPAAPILGNDEKLNLTVALTIICLPYAGFMFLNALQSAILNYQGRFFAGAFAPMILNIMLSGVLLLHPYFQYDPLYAMGWGAFASGALQSLFLFLAVKRSGVRLRFHKIEMNDNLRRFKKLFFPGLVSGGVTQINILVGSIIASFSAGAMSYLYFSDRVYQLPLGLIGVTLGVVLLPALVRTVTAHDAAGTRKLYNRSLEFAAFLTLPCSAALLFISEEIVRLLYEGGKFTPQDTQAVANILKIYALALPAFILIKLFSPGYYAKEDTKRPMKFALIDLLINAGLAALLFPIFSFYAIPTAGALAAWVNVYLLYKGLRADQSLVYDGFIKDRMIKIGGCCAVMAAVALGLKYGTPQFFAKDATVIAVSALMYFVFGYFFEIIPKSEFKKYMTRKKKTENISEI